MRKRVWLRRLATIPFFLLVSPVIVPVAALLLLGMGGIFIIWLCDSLLEKGKAAFVLALDWCVAQWAE